MNARDQAKAEIEHAIDALGDHGGQALWGPGVVGYHLWRRNEVGAMAFDLATIAVFQALRYGDSSGAPLGPDEQARFTAALRVVAPALLDVLLESEELKGPA